MHELERRFIEHWERRRFGWQGRPVLLALSGGLDSMVLARLLLNAGIPFAAAHCNFSLRGIASDEDAAFVSEWCASLGVPHYERVVDISTVANHMRQNIQAAARQFRYSWFEDLRREYKYSAILTAHHANDVAETVLMNLSRGTGIAGLHGIRERNGRVIRPLLFATRAEIEVYAHDASVAWREDSSNAKTDYLRNALRLEIIPKLEALLPGAVLRIAETAERVAGAEILFRAEADKRTKKLQEQRARDSYVPIKLLKKQEALPVVAHELFTPYSFGPEQIPQILRLMESESGRMVEGITHSVVRHRDFLVIVKKWPQERDLIVIDEIPKVITTSFSSFTFSWMEYPADIEQPVHVAMLDAAKISLPLILRTRREGDYFYPLGMGGKKKKLKRFLIDQKVPVHEKERIFILESEKKILWVAGYRIDERFKVRPFTQKILKVVFTPA